MESQAYYKLFAHDSLRVYKISELFQLLIAKLYALVNDDIFEQDKTLEQEY